MQSIWLHHAFPSWFSGRSSEVSVITPTTVSSREMASAIRARSSWASPADAANTAAMRAHWLSSSATWLTFVQVPPWHTEKFPGTGSMMMSSRTNVSGAKLAALALSAKTSSAMQTAEALSRLRVTGYRSRCCRLHEPERHAIALANRRILCAILVAHAIGRRQRPHTARMVPGVLRVGVDFGLPGEPEARLLGKGNHVGLGHVAALDHF